MGMHCGCLPLHELDTGKFQQQFYFCNSKLIIFFFSYATGEQLKKKQTKIVNLKKVLFFL